MDSSKYGHHHEDQSQVEGYERVDVLPDEFFELIELQIAGIGAEFVRDATGKMLKVLLQIKLANDK